MPKTRIYKRGAKSIARRIKHKIGGRKSTKGTNTMSFDEIMSRHPVRKRDKNKLRRAIAARQIESPC